MVSKYVYTPLHPKISLSSANTRQPTWGTVSTEGTSIVSVSADTPGFYARSVDDLEFLAHLFRLDSLLTEPLHPLSIIGARIAFVKTHIWPEAQSGTRAAWNLAHRLLAETGAKVEHVELPERFGNCPEWREIVIAEEARAAYLPSASVLSVSGPVLLGLVNLSACLFWLLRILTMLCRIPSRPDQITRRYCRPRRVHQCAQSKEASGGS